MKASRHLGFSLVGLVVTMTILVTISGVAGFYYGRLMDEQKDVVARSDLSEYAKHVRAYILRRGPIDDAALDLAPGEQPLKFLVDSGIFDAIKTDPWGREYQIDPGRGVVYSEGPEGLDESDDILVPYLKNIDGQATQNMDVGIDRIPPVITSVSPVGTLNVDDPVVRATFYDHFGGAIDASSVKIWIDQKQGTTLQSNGEGVLSTESVGQIMYTTNARYPEGTRTVVVQVADSSGNVARREWTFTIDTVPVECRILEPTPAQGTAVRRDVTIRVMANDDNLDLVKLEWDYLDLTQDLIPTWPNPMRPYVANVTYDTSGIRGCADGLHYVTLRARDASGRVVSDQVEIIVDNTAPTVVIKENPVGTIPGNPMKVPTLIPDFIGVAKDNIGIKWAEFTYFDTNDLEAGYPMTPRTGVPLAWDGTPPNDWGSLFSSVREEFSTTASANGVSVGGFELTTLEMGVYTVKFKAHDWAGNVSSEEPSINTSRFVIDLSGGGVVDPVLYSDDYNRQSPFLAKHERFICGMPPSVITATCTTDAALVRTKGIVRFSVLEKKAESYWKVIISDRNDALDVAGPDNIFIPDGTNANVPSVSHKFNWTSTGVNDLETDEYRFSDVYGVFANDPIHGIDADERRGETATSFTSLPQGTYHVRVSYDGYGLERTGFTTFFVDNELPDIEGADVLSYYNASGTRVPCPDGTVITSYTYTNGTDIYQLDLGAVVRDRPTTGLVTTLQWQDFANGVPISPMTSAYGPADFGAMPPSNVVTIGYVGSVAKMRVETDYRGGMDGRHDLLLIARDAAGLSAYTYKQFWVNVEGPIFFDVLVMNEKDGVKPIFGASASSTLSRIQDQYIEFAFKVRDERFLSRVAYRCYPRDGIAGGDTDIGNPPFVPNTAGNFNMTSLVLDRDSFGSAFASIPQSYTIDFWAVNQDGVQGPMFKTHFEFQYLVDLAIIAPAFRNDADMAWLSAREQQGIANYLYQAIANVATKRIYCADSSEANDRFVEAQRWPASDGHKTLPEWMSANTSDNTTDVLIILDGVSREIFNDQTDASPVEMFLDSDADGDDASDTQDGDVIVLIGAKPFKLWVGSSGSGNGTFGNSTKDEEQIAQVLDLHDTDDGRTPFRMYQTDSGGEKYIDDSERDNYMKHRNWKSGAFFPSLVEYRMRRGPNPSSKDLERWQASTYGVNLGDTLDNDSSKGASNWKLEERWNQHNGQNGEAGTAYMVQNLDSNGRFVQFMSMGDSSLWSEQREPIEQLPYLLEEFLKNYVVSRRDPSKTAKRVIFRSNTSGNVNMAVNGGFQSEYDLLRYPTNDDAKPFYNESPEDRQDVMPWGISSSGEKILFSTRRYSGSWPLTPLDSLYLLNNGAPSQLLACSNSGVGVGDAAIADTGVAAVCSSSRTALSSSTDYSDPVIYHFDLSSGIRSQITTGEPSDSAAFETSMSGDGRWAAFVSQRYYGKAQTWGNCYPPFTAATRTLATSSSNEVFRWSYEDFKIPTGSGGYVNAWVSKPDGTAFWPYENVECRNVRLSHDGKTCAWLSRSPATENKWELCLAREFAGSWYKARLTTNTDIQSMDMSSYDVEGSWPIIVFTSDRCVTGSGTYSGGGSNCMPDVATASDLDLADDDTNVANSKVRGVDCTGKELDIGDMRWKAEGELTYRKADGSGGPKLWMFHGFNRPCKFLVGGDRSIQNPCISPDGMIVTFESGADELYYVGAVDPADDDWADTVKIGTLDTGGWGGGRVFQLRIGLGATFQSSGEPSYMTNVTPVSIYNVGETEGEMHPFVGN